MDGEEKMKFYQTDWFLKVISVLISIVIWIYVVYEYNPQYEIWVRDIPITYVNRTQDFENGKMVVLDSSSEAVDIKIRGRRRLVSSIGASNTTATVDMAGISKEGTYTLPVNVHFAADGIEILQEKPYSQQLTVDKVVTEERQIEVDEEGQLADGYVVENETNSPATVQLTGPQSIISTVAKCSISVNFTNVRDDIKGLYKIKLYDAQNQEINTEWISKNIEYTDVYYAILPTKTVSVAPRLTAASNADGASVTASVHPAQVVVKGKQSELDALSALETVDIDVSGVTENQHLEVELALPNGVALLDGKNTVTVDLIVTPQE